MVELCNCPMLDTITPLMSWTNTPIATPRRTPIPTPHGTPLMTPRATPRCTPRTTPRATPTPSLGRRGYDYRSPSVCSNYSTIEDLILPPPRRKFVQAPEIFSSFTSKTCDEGSMVEFKCFISCAPLTTTTWEKDNMPVISGSHIVCTEKTGVSQLIQKAPRKMKTKITDLSLPLIFHFYWDSHYFCKYANSRKIRLRKKCDIS